MGSIDDPFATPGTLQTPDQFTALGSPPAPVPPLPLCVGSGVATGYLSGFDLADQPLLAGLASLPGQVIPARTTVALCRRMIGTQVVVLYEGADPRQPIIVGVIQQPAIRIGEHAPPVQRASIQADDEQFVVSAEREIVLRCGAASITLTRAGKVIITGNYIVSRSRGYNKIKGAAIELN